MLCLSTPTFARISRRPQPSPRRWARLLAAALAASPLAAPAPASAWVDPSTGLSRPTHVTRPAQIPERNWQPGHRGVDLGLRLGGPVRAAGTGVVAYAGAIAGTPVVSIAHPNGLRTTYQPVLAAVEAGDPVIEGAIIGVLAPSLSTHSGKHDGLHWGALIGPDTYIDPLTLLDPALIRLKPLDGAPPARRRHLPGSSPPPGRADDPRPAVPRQPAPRQPAPRQPAPV